MGKIIKRVLIVYLCVAMAFGVCPAMSSLTISAESRDTSTYEVGDIVELGWYPQTEVKNKYILELLNDQAPAWDSWTSYGYYSGTGLWDDGQMASDDYMRYTDVVVDDFKYRGVMFTSYRPFYTGSISSQDTYSTYQDDNGYNTNTVYWFRYDPLRWRVLKPSTGLVLCETIVDSQAYNNFVLRSDGNYYGDSDKNHYASNYAESFIRQWLNNDFYNTAFSEEQQSIIEPATLNNGCLYDPLYNAPDTEDQIFLLSFQDVYNQTYGFAGDNTRLGYGSDYAKCQGLGVNRYGEGWWRLRTAVSSELVYSVSCDGGMDSYFVQSTYYGVRPALQLDLSAAMLSARKPIAQGDIIEFGWYPQSEETDSIITTELNAKAPAWQSWTSYGYYSGTGCGSDGNMIPGSFMRYTDVMLDGKKYRGVKFTSYRPSDTRHRINEGTSFQEEHGYSTNTTYWFRFEPLKWRILDLETGLALCENIIDSQAFQNYSKRGTADLYYGNKEETLYANDYSASSIRKWLINDFVDTSFNIVQVVSEMKRVKLDNHAFHDRYSEYDSASVVDRIFLLSFNDAQKYKNQLQEIKTSTTDYAKCQGMSSWNQVWHLRTAGDRSSSNCYFASKRYDHTNDIGNTSVGVRPAFQLDLNYGLHPNVNVDKIGDGVSEEKSSIKAVYIYDSDVWYKSTSGLFLEVYAEDSDRSNYTATYRSLNEDVVSVRRKGILVANKCGRAVVEVTVTDDDNNVFVDTCTVTVKYRWWQWLIVIFCFGWLWY